ncbi:MAG TPA: undecaprenyldiphospho-muramoylpentapeptide beta-N-acetylglucosaminyltransferase [Rhodothermales bacterium]|nr:undecaprenyldiphospho-muramoylpentapeptide beta-N-acetylglucosaminyltransferase [Rhodothermales bacterium]
MTQVIRILMAGGGTGGHVYPAIAIADAIRRLDQRTAIEFAGTQDRMEWQAVPKAGYAIHPITVTGFQRRLTARNLAFPFKLLSGFMQSWNLIGAFDPDVVVGTGGYVSGPVLLSASLRGRPIVIQEQNAFAGATNRMLAKRATQIHVAFPEAERAFPKEKIMLSGNPTRKELLNVDGAAARAYYEVPEGADVLLVFGGSLGSAALNGAVQRRLDELLQSEKLYVIWQTGSQYYVRVKAQAPEHPRLRLLQYIDRMDYAYAAADLVLCRAGAITCSELMVTGTPSILVPSPNVTADHQTKNARSMETAGAALLLPEADLDDQLVPLVTGLMREPERRRKMSEGALRIAKPDAAEEIARHVLRLAGWQEQP